MRLIHLVNFLKSYALCVPILSTTRPIWYSRDELRCILCLAILRLSHYSINVGLNSPVLKVKCPDCRLLYEAKPSSVPSL